VNNWGRYILIFVCFALFALLIHCQSHTNISSVDGYLNLNDTVKYMGKDACQGCHQDIHASFNQHGMGLSFDLATREKSAAQYGNHVVLHDSVKNLNYHPYWSKDSLYIMEFRLNGIDTTHKRVEYVKYVVGSGQHTNSHIFEDNGYLYQAPITFFTQDGVWDLAPGFEGGANTSFNRIISAECMSCHNGASAEFVHTSLNKFNHVPNGISCENCHGAGELHIKQKLAGIKVDTAKHIDYSIVNPKDLTRKQQMDLCQRCHLQGISVLNDGKSFYDFKPSQHLSDVMQVFLPEYEEDNHFIMASHAERLRKSECFKQSEMTCLTCHDPHISSTTLGDEHYNAKCLSCHTTNHTQCSKEDETSNCISCHLPKSTTIDIPHVTIHDHFIRKEYTPVDKDKVATFVRLQCMTQENPDPITMAKGYLSFYEKYTQDEALLDSALYYLRASNDPNDAYRKTSVHYFYLANRYNEIEPFETKDAWTNYRIGESRTNNSEAIRFYRKAVKGKPQVSEFRNKLATMYMANNQLDSAANHINFVLKENPKNKRALTNAGYLAASKQQYEQAIALYSQVLSLDPDYEQAMVNKAGLIWHFNGKNEAKALINRVLEINPNNQQALNLKSTFTE